MISLQTLVQLYHLFQGSIPLIALLTPNLRISTSCYQTQTNGAGCNCKRQEQQFQLQKNKSKHWLHTTMVCNFMISKFQQTWIERVPIFCFTVSSCIVFMSQWYVLYSSVLVMILIVSLIRLLEVMKGLLIII